MIQETGNKMSATRVVSKRVVHQEVPQGCDLLVFFNNSEFRLTVTGRQPRQILAYESWAIQKMDEELTGIFDEILNESELLGNRNYRNIVCCSGISPSVLVPNSLYIPSESTEQLKFSLGKNLPGTVLTDDLKHCEAKNIFSIPDEVHNWIVRTFPHGQLHHTTSAMIDFLLWKHRGDEEDTFVIQVCPEYAEFIVARAKNLKLLNRYDFSTPEELVYYILFAMEQLQLNPDHVPLVFSGSISPEDHVFKLASKYIRNISMATLPDIVSGTSILGEIPVHTGFNIFCQQICAS